MDPRPNRAWLDALADELPPYLQTLSRYTPPPIAPTLQNKVTYRHLQHFFTARRESLCDEHSAGYEGIVASYLKTYSYYKQILKWIEDKQKACSFNRFHQKGPAIRRMCYDSHVISFVLPAMKIIRPVTCAVIGQLKTEQIPDISQFVSLAKAVDHSLMRAPGSYESEWHKPTVLCFFDVFCRLEGRWFGNNNAISQLDKSIDTAAAYIRKFCCKERRALAAVEQLLAMVRLRTFATVRKSLTDDNTELQAIISSDETQKEEMKKMYSTLNRLSHMSFLRDVVQRVQTDIEVRKMKFHTNFFYFRRPWFSSDGLPYLNYKMYETCRRQTWSFRDSIPNNQSHQTSCYKWNSCMREWEMWEKMKEIAHEHVLGESQNENSEFRAILDSNDKDRIANMYIDLLHLTCMPKIFDLVVAQDLENQLEAAWEWFQRGVRQGVWMEEGFVMSLENVIQDICTRMRPRVPSLPPFHCAHCKPGAQLWSETHPERYFHSKGWFRITDLMHQHVQKKFVVRIADALFTGAKALEFVDIRTAPTQNMKRFIKAVIPTIYLRDVQNYALRRSVDHEMRTLWRMIDDHCDEWFPRLTAASVASVISGILFYSNKWYEKVFGVSTDALVRGTIVRSEESARYLKMFQDKIAGKLQKLTEDPISHVRQTFERNVHSEISQMYSVTTVLGLDDITFVRKLRKMLMKCHVAVRSRQLFAAIPRISEDWFEVPNLLYLDYQCHCLLSGVVTPCGDDDEVFQYAWDLVWATIEQKVEVRNRLVRVAENRFHGMGEKDRREFSELCPRLRGTRHMFSCVIMAADIKTTGDMLELKYGDINAICPREMTSLSEVQLQPTAMKEETFIVASELFKDLANLNSRCKMALGIEAMNPVLKKTCEKEMSLILDSENWGRKGGLLKLAFHFVNGLMSNEADYVQRFRMSSYFHHVSKVMSDLTTPSNLQFLCRRHLSYRMVIHDQKWTSSASMYNYERHFMQCLEEEMGADFVKPMKAIVNNMDDKIRDYYFNGNDDDSGLSIPRLSSARVTILKQSNWPNVEPDLFELPPDLASLLARFKQDMEKEEPQKNISFFHGIGEVVLAVSFVVDGEPKIVSVTGGVLQCAVLIIMASKLSMSYADLERQLVMRDLSSEKQNIVKAKLYAAVLSLLDSKFTLITKTPSSKKIAPTDVIRIGTVQGGFKSIILPKSLPWMEKEGQENISRETSSTSSSSKSLERRWSVDAVRSIIMREMKQKKEMKVAEVYNFVVTELRGRFYFDEGEEAFVKKQLGFLLEAELVKYQTPEEETLVYVP